MKASSLRYLQAQRYVILAVTLTGIVTALAKSAGEFRKIGNDRTVTSEPVSVPLNGPRPSHPWKEFIPTTKPGNIAGVMAAIGLMLASGFFAGSLLLGANGNPLVRLLLLGLSVPLGFGLHSCAGFALMLCGRLDSNWLIMSVPVVNFLIIVAWLIMRARRPAQWRSPPAPVSVQPHELIFPVILLLACCAGPIAKRLGGDWDALYFWNARAASILCAGYDWRWAYDGTIDPAYNDYPLCLPLTIATIWSYAGQMTFVVPLALSILALFSIAAILYATVGLLSQGRIQRIAILAVLLFASLPALGRVVAGQRADLLLTSAILGSAATIVLALRLGERRFLRLCLPMAVCAAWIKNEGLVFAVLAVAIAIWIVRSERWPIKSIVSAALAMAAPFIVAIVSLKVSISHANDLWTFQTTSAPGADATADRIFTIIRAFGVRLGGYLYLPYAAVVAICILNARTVWAHARVLAIVLAGMTCAYFAVFLFTPRDLQWHLEHSEKRLLVHLWPLWVLLLYMIQADREPKQLCSIQHD